MTFTLICDDDSVNSTIAIPDAGSHPHLLQEVEEGRGTCHRRLVVVSVCLYTYIYMYEYIRVCIHTLHDTHT